MDSPVLRLGTRPSKLAIAQAQLVKRAIEAKASDVNVELVPIKTSGDRLKRGSLAQVGGKGLFVKELQQALRAGIVDVNVHSMKDLPARLAPDLRILAIPPREDVRDALVTCSEVETGLKSLPERARLGTSSIRRKFMALRARSDLEIINLRGNVDSRLAKLSSGQFDGVILALAGLKRLTASSGCSAAQFAAATRGWWETALANDRLWIAPLDQWEFVPSAGQGALALETLAHKRVRCSEYLESVLASLNDSVTVTEVLAERSFIETINASCNSPVGVCARLENEVLRIKAMLFDAQGTRAVEAQMSVRIDEVGFDPKRVGRELGEKILANGGRELLEHE